MASHDRHRRRSSARKTSLTAPNSDLPGASVAHRRSATKVASRLRGLVLAPRPLATDVKAGEPAELDSPSTGTPDWPARSDAVGMIAAHGPQQRRTVSDEVPDSFHPAIAGRERPMAELADTVRRLVDLVVTNTAPPDVLDSVVAQLRSTADVLAAHVPTQPVPRFIDPPEGLRGRARASAVDGRGDAL